MADQTPCPRCRQENPPRNRSCGSCGAPLMSGEQLARREYRPVPAGRAWPAKLGPVSKVLAVSVAALAAEAGLSWLRHKIGAEDRSSVPAYEARLCPAWYLVGRGAGRSLRQMWEIPRLVRRAARGPIVSSPTGPTGRRR